MKNFDVPLGVVGKNGGPKKPVREHVTAKRQPDDIATRMQLDLDAVWSPKDLLNFFANHYERAHGYPYPMDMKRDPSVARAFIGRWEERAGKIVKFLFDEYGGVYMDQKQGVEFMSKGSHWVAAKVYDEMVSRENQTDQSSRRGSFTDANSFLSMFGD